MTVTPVACSQERNVESSRRCGPAAGPLRRGRAAACNSTRSCVGRLVLDRCATDNWPGLGQLKTAPRTCSTALSLS